ncbi:MAG: hypothetical protein WCD44_02390, partial [Candidatus Babeliales bacterium]
RIELEQAKQREKEIARRQLEGAREDARRRIEQAREEERREIEELEGELDRIQKEAKQAKEKLSRLEGTQNELEELKGTNEELQRIQQELTNTQTEAAAGRISVEQLNRQIEALRQDLVNTDYALKQTQEQVSKEALGKLEFEERLEQISQQIATPIHEQIAIIENNIKTEHEKSPDKYAQINFLPILSRIEEIDKQIESATAQLTKNDKENLLNGVDTLKQELADALAKNARQLAVNIGEVVNNIDRYIKSQSHPELQFTIDEMRIKNPITNRINKELDSILQNELFFEYLNLASPGYQKNAKSEIARIANAYRLLGLSFKQYLDQLNKTNQQNYTDKTLKIEDFNNTVDVIKVMKWVIDNAYTPFQEKLGRLVDDLEELIVDFNSIMSIEKQKLYEIYRAKPGEKENTIKILQAVTDPAEGEDFLEYSEDQEDQLINIPPSIAEITQSYEEELKESAPQMPTVPATEEEEEEVSDPTGLEG